MKAVVRELVLGAALILAMLPAARAADRTVTLKLGVASRLQLDRIFETVLVGDPDVVGVYPDDAYSVILSPQNPGVTNLVFVDARHIVLANIRISVCPAIPKPDAQTKPVASRDEEAASPCAS
jgi:Flp pilus assembly secretin CpaC